MGYGQSQSGCSQTLLGNNDYSDLSALENKRVDSSFVYNYLKEAYMYKEYVTISKKKYRIGSSVTIGLSVWCLFENEVIDLCHYKDRNTPNLHSKGSKFLPKIDEFAVIECPTIDIALQVISTARFEKLSTFRNSKEMIQFSHMFVRVTMHSHLITSTTDEYRTCYCQLIDLVGIGRNIRGMSESDVIIYRRVLNSLGCFSKVINEMKEVSMRSAASNNVLDKIPGYDTSPSPTSPSGLARVTSARESMLTKILSPFLMGNYKCYYVLFLQDGSTNHVHIKTILNTFEHVQRNVKCTCYIEQVYT